MKQLKQRLQNGFTLIEVLIVVVILGILVSIAVPTYLKYVQKGYASDAKVSIKAILNANTVFENETGFPAGDIETLEDEGYLELEESVKTKWQFEITETEVAATSLEGMKGGAGERVTFYIEEGIFKGYGQSEQE
jgi:prepilin-type N-terminal cleavage/methylation domain-containing protein